MIDYESVGKRYFENGGYAEAPEMVTDELKHLMKCIDEIISKNNYLHEEDDGGFIKNCIGKHGLHISNLLLLYFKDHYSKIVQKNLVPTYSYTRTYYKGSKLPRHSDRAECQYSITLNIGGSNEDPWPFWCKSKILEESSPTEIHNEMFVPIIYMGEAVSHWREVLAKKYSTHIFLHYVDGDDPNYKHCWYDGKEFIR
jgi:hypothetical protein